MVTSLLSPLLLSFSLLSWYNITSSLLLSSFNTVIINFIFIIISVMIIIIIIIILLSLLPYYYYCYDYFYHYHYYYCYYHCYYSKAWLPAHKNAIAHTLKSRKLLFFTRLILVPRLQYSIANWSVPWLMMAWLLVSPGHLPAWWRHQMEAFLRYLPLVHFCVTCPVHQWITLTKASDAKLWCFLWCTPEQMVD